VKTMLTPEELVDKYVGIPYVDNGRDPAVGLDCWGLIISIIKDLYGYNGLPDPKYRKFTLLRRKVDMFKDYDMFYWADTVKGEPVCGDFILIRVIGIAMHGGIYVANGEFLHAVAGKGIRLCNMPFWKKQVQGIYRLKDEFKSVV